MQAKPFFFVADELNLRVHLTTRLQGMLGSIKHERPAVNTHCGDHVGILRHISCPVDLSRMVNLLHDVELHLRLLLLATTTVATNLLLVTVVIVGIGHEACRNVDICDLKIVLSIARSMGAEEETVSGDITAGNTARHCQGLRSP